MTDPLLRLEALVADRATGDPALSYTARLLATGLPLVARKLGEEAVEVVVAALSADRDALIGEAADLLYHLAVLLRAREVAVADIAAELARREDRSGIAEKASRAS